MSHALRFAAAAAAGVGAGWLLSAYTGWDPEGWRTWSVLGAFACIVLEHAVSRELRR